MAETVPPGWMPKAFINGIVFHWTAGAHEATEFDRQHYHILINADGKLVRGIPTIDLNSLPAAKKGYAAHTLGNNTGWIGVSLCCMGDFKTPSRVKENPFVAGPYPMTREQWAKLPLVLADLCRRYGISVSRKTVLSHAEVQDTLKKPQRGKWDISVLAFDPTLTGAHAIGDMMRRSTIEAMKQADAMQTLVVPVTPVSSPPLPAAKPTPILLKQYQSRLKELGDYGGDIDGMWGEKTTAAIASFKHRHGLGGVPEFDKAMVAVLLSPEAKPYAVSPERATATAETLRSSAPIVAEAEQSETVAKAGTVGAAAVGGGTILGQFAGYASTIRAAIGDVPPWVWGLVLLSIAATMGFLWWRARRIKQRRVAMHNVAEVA